ncbi:hypothetical protein GCM10010384_06870 [Streptomyces djakartensis]|uniref:Uncharacterized protein n=1 Tax=Streptomyces djakartensis TaxID=68193 RepID=A0ABQ2Z5I3_9ACTN|nr:hypothetical protein GCM10010384_06870 [Streptomyces djakartensis]
MLHSIAADWAELEAEGLLCPDPLRRVGHPVTVQRSLSVGLRGPSPRAHVNDPDGLVT